MNRLRLSAGSFLGSVASIVTIVVAVLGGRRDATTTTVLALWMLFAMGTSLIVVLIWQEYRFSRKTRYAVVLGNITAAVHARNEVYGDADVKDLYSTLQQQTNQVSQAFTLITGTQVGTCLRSVNHELNHQADRSYYAEDICRDDQSQNRVNRTRHTSLAERAVKAPVHYLSSSTAYSYLLMNIDAPLNDFYLCNNLPREPGYHAVSFSVYGKPKGGPMARLFPGLGWTLPYKSTLILRLVRTEPKTGKSSLVGFLNLDSPSVNVFNNREDVELLRLFMAVIRPTLTTYLSKMTEAEKETLSITKEVTT